MSEANVELLNSEEVSKYISYLYIATPYLKKPLHPSVSLSEFHF